MGKEVWVVEKGEYSDYRVVGVFSSADNAQLVADAINKDADSWGKASVACWPLDPAVKEMNAGMVQYLVHMLRDGTTESVRREEFDAYELNGNVRMWRRSTAPAYKGKGVQDVLVATVWAIDDVHAIKITNEHRTRMIVNGEWE